MTEQELFNKYPEIFGLFKDNYYRISSFIPKGWIQIVDILCGSVQDYIKTVTKWTEEGEYTPPQMQCEQVKEKYGGLRFYARNSDDEMEGMIKMAEYMASITCQECGKPGSMKVNGGWYTTLCNECEKEFYK